MTYNIIDTLGNLVQSLDCGETANDIVDSHNIDVDCVTEFWKVVVVLDW